MYIGYYLNRLKKIIGNVFISLFYEYTVQVVINSQQSFNL